MILTATGRAVTAAFVGAQSTAGDSRTRTRGCYATEAAMEIFVSARGVTRPGRKGPRSWNRSWPRRRADRHAQGGPQRRVPADRSHAAGVDQDRPLAARITRLNPPRRSSERGGGRVDARTQPSGESATPGQAEEAGDVLAALAVVDDCGRRRVSDVGLDAARAASPGSRAPQDRAGTDLREAR